MRAETARAYANKTKRLSIVAEARWACRIELSCACLRCEALQCAEPANALVAASPARSPAQTVLQDINQNFHSSAGELQRLIPIQR